MFHTLPDPPGPLILQDVLIAHDMCPLLFVGQDRRAQRYLGIAIDDNDFFWGALQRCALEHDYCQRTFLTRGDFAG